MIPKTDLELDTLLAVPAATDIEAMGRLDGPLLVLGAGGKMGPTLAARAALAAREAGSPHPVIAVSRFTEAAGREWLEQLGVRTIGADLLAPGALEALPDAPNVIFMAARKFGSSGQPSLTWTTNALLPGLAARRYSKSRIVAFSTGNVYAFTPVDSGGPDESTPLDPVGEYAWSALARERLFEQAAIDGARVALVRLNYACDLRYGVLHDLARKILERTPIDLAMGHVNLIWQGDANSVAIRLLDHAASPALAVNVTSPGTYAVRDLAARLAERLGVEPVFVGKEAPTALLSNASLMVRLLGAPATPLEWMLDATAEWLRQGGRSLGKPTKFQVRDGAF
ncbi:MAG: NAD(P)-dependent oxidoreductase [Bryobacter sp.]|jgi:nucleoside-diphosphate-sugar epimerase|nr:NAD(P)-dependent oxidoreductase [Bryobacter sp.]